MQRPGAAPQACNAALGVALLGDISRSGQEGEQQGWWLQAGRGGLQGLVEQAEQRKEEEKRAQRHVNNDQKVLRELWHCSAAHKWEPAEESQLLVGVLGDQNVLHGDQDLSPSSPAHLSRGPGAGAICVPWAAAAWSWAALARVCWGRQDSCPPADMAAIPHELEFPSPPWQPDGWWSKNCSTIILDIHSTGS